MNCFNRSVSHWHYVWGVLYRRQWILPFEDGRITVFVNSSSYCNMLEFFWVRKLKSIAESSIWKISGFNRMESRPLQHVIFVKFSNVSWSDDAARVIWGQSFRTMFSVLELIKEDHPRINCKDFARYVNGSGGKHQGTSPNLHWWHKTFLRYIKLLFFYSFFEI